MDIEDNKESEIKSLVDLDNLEDENGEPLLDDQKPVDDIRQELDIPDGDDELNSIDDPILTPETVAQQTLAKELHQDHDQG